MLRLRKTYIVLSVAIILAFMILFYIHYSGLTGNTSTSTGKRYNLPIPDEVGMLIENVDERIIFRVDDFPNGSRIPLKYTCDGLDVSPPIAIEYSGANASTYLLVVYDPDAPRGVFYHWVIYNIPGNTTVLPEGIEKKSITGYGVQGVNDFGKTGYNGPCPPSGHGVHRYIFILLALDDKLPVSINASPHEILFMARNHVIAYGVYYGTYSR